MKGWRSKLLFVLFVYFCGFASAISVLVPGSGDLAEEQGRTKVKVSKGIATSILKSDDFAHSFRAGMDKWLDFGRDVSVKVADSVRKKYSSRDERSDG